MIPKGKLLALLMVFTAVGGLAATGAFTTVEAERTADMNVEGDAGALLAIQPTNETTETEFLTEDDTTDSEFQINLEEAQLNTNATTTQEDFFNITNNGENTVAVWIATQGGVQDGSVGSISENVNTTFYVDNSTGGVTPDEEGEHVDINNRINEYDTFVDTSGESEDYVISQPTNSSESVGEEPDVDGIAVELEPGETVSVSMAIEIDDPNGDLDLSPDGNGDPILEEVVILASADVTGDSNIGVQADQDGGNSDQ
jgi:hypothetical protein